MAQEKPKVKLPSRDGDYDWAQVQYETTDWSIDQIAKAINRTATSIIYRISHHGWTRNKGAEVAKLTAELVLANRERQRDEREHRLEIIEKVNTEMQAKVLMEHRKDIKSARQVSTKFWGELTALTEEDAPLGERINMLKRLAEASKTLILLERQAFGIQGAIEDPEEPTVSPLESQAMDNVLNKFASILEKTGHKVSKDMGQVVEMETSSPSRETSSPSRETSSPPQETKRDSRDKVTST